MLEQIHEFIKEYHVLAWGAACLVGLFAFTACFRTFWGTKRRKSGDDFIKY